MLKGCSLMCRCGRLLWTGRCLWCAVGTLTAACAAYSVGLSLQLDSRCLQAVKKVRADTLDPGAIRAFLNEVQVRIFTFIWLDSNKL